MNVLVSNAVFVELGSSNRNKMDFNLPVCVLTIRLNILRWFGHVQRMEENRIPKRVLYMNLGTTRLRGRPRNIWQDEVKEDGRIVGGEGWQEKVHNREEWKKLLRTARNRRILHLPMECICASRIPGTVSSYLCAVVIRCLGLARSCMSGLFRH